MAHDATTETKSAGAGKYFVKCDECRETMRYTDSLHESACGGICPKCRAEINAKLAKKKASKQRGATKAQLAHRAKLFGAASPSIHDDAAAVAGVLARAS